MSLWTDVELHEALEKPFGFCGCSQPDEALIELLLAADWYRRGLAGRRKNEAEPTMLAQYVLAKVGFTEHGGSVSAGRLSARGRDWLERWWRPQLSRVVEA